jgi:hypothetical protein
MKVIDVPANTRVFLGVPAHPLPETVVSAIAREVFAIEGIEEIHLPQCFALGVMDTPATVLVLIAGANLPPARAAKKAKRILKRLLPDGQDLDLWALRFDSPYVQAVMQANCSLERDVLSLPAFRKPKAWWRLIGVC